MHCINNMLCPTLDREIWIGVTQELLIIIIFLALQKIMNIICYSSRNHSLTLLVTIPTSITQASTNPKVLLTSIVGKTDAEKLSSPFRITTNYCYYQKFVQEHKFLSNLPPKVLNLLLWMSSSLNNNESLQSTCSALHIIIMQM